MGSATTGTQATLVADLVTALGDAVSVDPARRALFGQDIFAAGADPVAIVRPRDVAQVQAGVRLCAAAGVAMVPRGGGASYTDGYLHPGPHVLFDMAGLDSIEIDTANASVRVGAGVTWAVLKDALAAHGLRTRFWGPFSGLAATVGGSISQNTISHGSGRHGISAQSVSGIEVVLADGSLMNTAAAPATRFYGPDMTGLFTGDCGALGLKIAITLPLIAIAPAFEALSFAFADFAAYHAAIRAAVREELDDTHFSFDQALSQGQIERQTGLAARLAIARGVLRVAPSFGAGVRQLLRMALAGERELRVAAYTVHYIVEGSSAAEASAKAARLRQIIAPHGIEIANSVPAFVRAMPFAPLHNILGPKGERWVPVHGIFPHAQALAFDAAYDAFIAANRAEMDRLGVWTGKMFSSVGSGGLLFEIAIYWPDARDRLHDVVLGPEHLATIPAYPTNPEARAFIDRFKAELIALMDAHGSAHFQIGRAYPYRARLDPAASALLGAIKA
jgi:glycolate oxidase